jgi:hypothetical protein
MIAPVVKPSIWSTVSPASAIAAWAASSAMPPSGLSACR